MGLNGVRVVTPSGILPLSAYSPCQCIWYKVIFMQWLLFVLFQSYWPITYFAALGVLLLTMCERILRFELYSNYWQNTIIHEVAPNWDTVGEIWSFTSLDWSGDRCDPVWLSEILVRPRRTPVQFPISPGFSFSHSLRAGQPVYHNTFIGLYRLFSSLHALMVFVFRIVLCLAKVKP